MPTKYQSEDCLRFTFISGGGETRSNTKKFIICENYEQLYGKYKCLQFIFLTIVFLDIDIIFFIKTNIVKKKKKKKKKT